MPHIHEKIDFTASVYIVHGNKVLLRMHDKYKFWLGPDIKLFESHAQKNVPNVYAKDDSHHKELVPPMFLNRHFVSPSHEHVDLVYLATSESDVINPAAGEEKDNSRWFTAEELKDPAYDLREDVAHYAQKALELLST